MALTSGSKILVSDISTALGGKIDTAGTGLSKSGTSLALATVTTSGGTAGPTANATPSYGSTFTVPKVVYDKYGRVTGHTNYTVKIPAAPSGGSASTLSNVFSGVSTGGTSLVLPSGGTWKYFGCYTSESNTWGATAGSASGGSTPIQKWDSSTACVVLFACRVS